MRNPEFSDGEIMRGVVPPGICPVCGGVLPDTLNPKAEVAQRAKVENYKNNVKKDVMGVKSNKDILIEKLLSVLGD